MSLVCVDVTLRCDTCPARGTASRIVATGAAAYVVRWLYEDIRERGWAWDGEDPEHAQRVTCPACTEGDDAP